MCRQDILQPVRDRAGLNLSPLTFSQLAHLMSHCLLIPVRKPGIIDLNLSIGSDIRSHSAAFHMKKYSKLFVVIYFV